MSRQPYRQGDLDGLCGVYALVNAVKLVAGPVSLEQGLGLVEDCLVNLSQRAKVARLVTQGLGINQMIGLIRDVLKPNYPVTYHRPFAKASQVSLDYYWRSIQDFLGARPRRTVIIAMHTAQYDHWSLVKGISGKSMELFDSKGNSRVIRRYCTTRNFTAHRHVTLWPTATIFVKRTDPIN